VAGVTGVSGTGYRWYVTAQVVSLLGTMMGYTALFWLVLHLRPGGAPALAAVDAALCLPMLLFSRRAGIIVARYRAARVLMVTQALLAVASLAIGVPLLAGRMSIWYLVPLAFATGCVQCVDLPARQTFMLDLVGPGDLRRGTSLFATVTGLAKIAGPAVAGIIIAVTGETVVFFIDAASFLGVIAVMAYLSSRTGSALSSRTGSALSSRTGSALSSRTGSAPHHAAEPATRVPAARRFRWLLDLPPGVRAAIGMALLVGGFGLQFAVTNPLMAGRVFHLGSVGFGLFGTFMAVGGIAGSYYSSRRRDPGHREFLAWSLVFGGTEALAAVAPAAWAYCVAMVVLGAASQLFAVSATVYVQQATPAGQRGPALSAYNAGFIGFVPAGAFVVAAIASAAGTRWALAGPGLAIAACAAAMLLNRRTGLPSSVLAAQAPSDQAKHLSCGPVPDISQACALRGGLCDGH
jgi:hypothetical protein